jgi:hypothetical protein
MYEGEYQMHQPFQVNVGVIFLSKEKSLLLNELMQLSLERQS